MKPSQVDVLHTHLFSGSEIDRVSAFRWYGIADIRSRISDMEKRYGLHIDRCKVTGKKYYKYFIKTILK